MTRIGVANSALTDRPVQLATRSDITSRLDRLELPLCFRFNAACRSERVKRLFAVVSRLGDGVFWYALIGALPLLWGPEALEAALCLAGVGVLAVVIYRCLKGYLRRPRPFVLNVGIRPETTPLDQYSFPSGHTLHATAFTLVACSYYPNLAWLLVPFTGLVALSRVILGLHYPSDVVAGAAIGIVLAVPFMR